MSTMPQIECIARAVIVNDGRILVCKYIDNDNYFYPGGHIEFSETAQDALVREIREELGVASTVGQCIGVQENIYLQKGEKHHEINIVFQCQLETKEVSSQEEKLVYEWMKIEDLSETTVLPSQLTAAVKKWLIDGSFFWIAQKSLVD